MLATLLVQYNPDGSLVYQNPYLNTQLVMGRQPFQYVEIDLDYCANTAGVAPCAASQTGDAKCFNTYATCNDEFPQRTGIQPTATTHAHHR